MAEDLKNVAIPNDVPPFTAPQAVDKAEVTTKTPAPRTPTKAISVIFFCPILSNRPSYPVVIIGSCPNSFFCNKSITLILNYVSNYYIIYIFINYTDWKFLVR